MEKNIYQSRSKNKAYDYLIVGAGFAGCVLARRIAEEKNLKVLIIEKREHIGGNSYDYFDSHGVLIHKYGPHYFRTDNEVVWNFLSRFTDWRYYQYIVKAYVDGQLFDFPINLNTINCFYNLNLSYFEAQSFLDTIREKIPSPKNSEEQVLSKVGRDIYEKFFKNYTKKQWSIDPVHLDPSVTARIPVRLNKDPRYFTSKYQAMPKLGYTELFKNILDHKNIDIRLSTDYQDVKNISQHVKTIYTGCIDEYFQYALGRLPYRSCRFEYESYNQEFYQSYSQINYPNDYDFTRTIEIKHCTGQKSDWTTIVREYPTDTGDPLYPIPTKENDEIYEKYRLLANKETDVRFVGRLAQYKYFNMDQVINEAFEVFYSL